jgi:hypothetical protein
MTLNNVREIVLHKLSTSICKNQAKVYVGGLQTYIAVRRKQQTAGQVGLACINANCISDRQQEPVGNREGVLPVASKEAMESPSFMEGEDVNYRFFL